MKIKALSLPLILALYPNKEQKMGHTLKIIVGGNLENSTLIYFLKNFPPTSIFIR